MGQSKDSTLPSPSGIVNSGNRRWNLVSCPGIASKYDLITPMKSFARGRVSLTSSTRTSGRHKMRLKSQTCDHEDLKLERLASKRKFLSSDCSLSQAMACFCE